jgi:hypothetical protein
VPFQVFKDDISLALVEILASTVKNLFSTSVFFASKLLANSATLSLVSAIASKTSSIAP